MFVATFGPNKDFPAFYSRTSGLKSPYNLKNAHDAAKVVLSNRQICLNSGQLIAVPVPEEHAMNFDDLEVIIQNALKQANDENVTGKEITPFLLAHIAAETKGESLKTSILEFCSKLIALEPET